MFKTRITEPWVEAWAGLDATANAIGLPKEWISCPFCGEYGWRFPPHMMNPCPLVVSAHESAGLKVDAERMAALRAGIHVENMGKAMNAYMRDHGLMDDEEEEESPNE